MMAGGRPSARGRAVEHGRRVDARRAIQLWFVLVVTGAWCLGTTVRAANVVVVSPSASQDQPCVATAQGEAPAAPCASIPAALSATTAGDEVVLGAGVYTGSNAHELMLAGQTLRCNDTQVEDDAPHPDEWGSQALGCRIDCAQSSGPALWMFGGAALGVTSAVVGVNITGCVGFDVGGNTYFGAAALVGGGAATLRLRRVAIESSIAHYGGGIYASDDATVVCEGVLIGRGTGEFGGGMFLTGRAHAELHASVIEGHTSLSTGGAVQMLDSASLLLDDGSILRNNIALRTSDAGGAIHLMGAATLSIVGAMVVDNQAPAGAGGAFSVSDQATVVLQHAVVSRNTAGVRSGAFEAFGAGVTIEIDGSTLEDNSSPGPDAGAVALQDASLTIKGGSVVRGSSGGIGGAVHAFGASTLNVVGPHTLVAGSEATLGGAIVASETATIVISNGAVLSGNVAHGTGLAGGALSVLGTATAELRDCRIQDNRASAGQGGAIVVADQGTLLVLRSELFNNAAADRAGAIEVNGAQASATVANSTVLGNSAGFGAGCVSVVDGELLVENGTSFSNCSGNYGGAIHAWGAARLRVQGRGTEIAGSRATWGGGVAASGNARVFVGDGVALVGNSAETAGAGIFATDSAAVTTADARIERCSSQNGGGVYVLLNATLQASSTSFVGNSAVHYGGAINVAQRGSVTLVGSVLVDNTASSPGTIGRGGGIAVADTGVVQLGSGVRVLNCSAAVGGKNMRACIPIVCCWRSQPRVAGPSLTCPPQEASLSVTTAAST